MNANDVLFVGYLGLYKGKVEFIVMKSACMTYEGILQCITTSIFIHYIVLIIRSDYKHHKFSLKAH